MKNIVFYQEFCSLALAAPAVLLLAMLPGNAESAGKYTASVDYKFRAREDDDGNEFDANIVSLRLLEKLSSEKSQYFSLTGSMSEFDNSTDKIDGNALTAAYGQIWKTGSPGLYLNFGGFAGYGNNEGAPGNDNNDLLSGGINAGVTQIIPLSGQDMFSLGSGFSLSYIGINNEPDSSGGLVFSAYPFIQYDHIFTDAFSGHVRFGASFSNRNISLDSEQSLYTPSVGFDYKIGDYKLGLDYYHEFNSGHRGQQIGISLSKSF